jgi:hypothetical protein
LSKRSLMLSTAAAALLSAAALADTTIDASKSEGYTTGALLTDNTGQENAGNITIKNTGSLAVDLDNQGAITINSNNWLLNQGSISNKNKDTAYGVHVDLSADRDFSAASFTNTAGTTINGTGIYFDSGAGATLSSSSGTGKVGIYLDASGCSAANCTYRGNVTLDSGSGLSLQGDSSTAIKLSNTAILAGDMTLAGSISDSANTTSNTDTSVYGLLSLGQIQGNVSMTSTGSLTVYGHGSRAMSIQGSGVTGYISIGGTLASSVTSPQVYSYTDKVNTTTNPEAGPALEVSANVGGGIAILGPTSSGAGAAAATVSVSGTGPAIDISPALNSSLTPTGPLTIGVFNPDTADPGFSFYNRGGVTITPTNYNDSATVMRLTGYSVTQHTILTGGLFNSGTMTSSVVSSNSSSDTTGLGATGLYIGDYVDFLPNASNKIAGSSATVPGDQAALVNSGAAGNGHIIASVTGTKGGVATAVYISTYASVPSIINTGTIHASATVTDGAISGNTSGSSFPLAARAIVDASGTVTSIYNGGTISAVAGYEAANATNVIALDNNSQIATAIDLRGGDDTKPSGSGVTIKNYSGSSAATITGDILFGTGKNQVLDLQGTGNNASTVTGNVIFGSIASGSTSGDKLIIGNNASLTGAVLTREVVRGAGVDVSVATHGTLTLLNNSDALKPLGIDCSLTPQICTLNANSFSVANGGTVNLGVNRSMSVTGGLVSARSVNFTNGSNLGITYASFIPQNVNQFVLMTADSGNLFIDPMTLSAYNNTTNGKYLLKTATLCMTTQANCPRPQGLADNLDALILDVTPQSANELGLTANSIAVTPITTAAGKASTLFEQANLALGIDDALGAAMINGIHNAAEAQKAYNAFAPNLTGGTRAITIAITDSATGPVAARQRMLRMYSHSDGDMTLWGQEFVQMIKDPGNGAIDANTGFKTTPGFKDHGFGFVLGLDGGSPKYGWYGGAFTFYAGDVNELSRVSHQNQQWYLLTLYSTWRGKGLFLDTKLDAGYGHIDGTRSIMLSTDYGTFYREADNKHAGALISGSVATGAMFSYGAATFMPQVNLDGLYVREEGYTEHNPNSTSVGDGFDLKVNQSYAKSLRAFIGLNARYDLELWDFFLQPEARAGYRYDFISDPAKIKAAFAYADTSNPTVPTAGPTFTLTGPDPSQGNFVVGGTLSATTDAWSLGFNFDLVRGSNGAFEQVGTISILGRI